MKPSPRMNRKTRRFIHNQIILIISNYLDIDIKDRRLLSQSRVNKFIPVFNCVVNWYLLAVYCDSSSLDWLLVVGLVVGFELLDQCLKEGFAIPAGFCEGLVFEMVGQNCFEWKQVHVYLSFWLDSLLNLLFLHLNEWYRIVFFLFLV